jgi:hypothetical protein
MRTIMIVFAALFLTFTIASPSSAMTEKQKAECRLACGMSVACKECCEGGCEHYCGYLVNVLKKYNGDLEGCIRSCGYNPSFFYMDACVRPKNN